MGLIYWKKLKTLRNHNLKVFIYTGRDLSSKEEFFLNKYTHTVIIKNEHSPQRLKDELELYLNSSNGNVEVFNQAEVDKAKSLHWSRG